MEGQDRRDARAAFKKSLDGNLAFPFPKEGEYFGKGSSPHYLPPTDVKIAFGGAETFTGGHFERTCKPIEHARWMRVDDFKKTVCPLKAVADNRMALGHVVMR